MNWDKIYLFELIIEYVPIMITKEHFITPVLGVTYPTWGILPHTG